MNAPKTSHQPFMPVSSKKVFVIGAVVWLASVLGAYMLGSRDRVERRPLPSMESAAAARAVSPTSEAVEPERVAVPKLPGAEEEGDAIGPKSVQARVDRAFHQLSRTWSNAFVNVRAILQFMGPMADLTPEELQEALKHVNDKSTAPHVKGLIMSLLLSQWAEADPAKAMAYATTNSRGKGYESLSMVLPVVDVWLKNDPDAVWNWYLTHTEKEGLDQWNDGALNAIFSTFASHDVDGALEKLASLQGAGTRSAIAGIGYAAANPTVRDALTARLPKCTPEVANALRYYLMDARINRDPKEALVWVDSLPKDEQKAAREAAGDRLMRSDPRVAAEVLLKNATEKTLPTVYMRVIAQWASISPAEASKWLMEQPQGPALDLARNSLAIHIVDEDPVSAMEWAKSVIEVQTRESAIARVYGRWAARDEAAATKALRESGLSTEKQEQVIRQRKR